MPARVFNENHALRWMLPAHDRGGRHTAINDADRFRVRRGCFGEGLGEGLMRGLVVARREWELLPEAERERL
jgi:hypothetical protein